MIIDNYDRNKTDLGSHFLVWINGDLVFNLLRREIYSPLRSKREIDEATRSQIGGRGKRVDYRLNRINQRHPRY